MTDNAPVIAQLPSLATHALLRSRRSIRYYRPEIPPVDLLERIFVSAATAPSAHNRQPWRYVVITQAAAKSRLAGAMGVRLAADRSRDGDDEYAIEVDVQRSHRKITEAPVVMGVKRTQWCTKVVGNSYRPGHCLVKTRATGFKTQKAIRGRFCLGGI
jgi:nitroreductase